MFSKRNWKNFLLNEAIEDRTIFTYIQGLQEFVNNFSYLYFLESLANIVTLQNYEDIEYFGKLIGVNLRYHLYK